MTNNTETTANQPTINIVNLLFLQSQDFSIENVLRKLRSYYGQVNLKEEEDHWSFYFDDLARLNQLPFTPCFMLIRVINKNEVQAFKGIDSAISHSRTLSDAEKIVKNCHGGMTFFEFTTTYLPYQLRLQLFQHILSLIVENTNCELIHWVNSQELVLAKTWLENSLVNKLFGFVNERLFNIEHTENCLMDTLGLNSFGLPDLQCLFHNSIDPNLISNNLFDLAYYLFDEGDIIADNNTVPGIKEGEVWICERQLSLAEPHRLVINLNS